MNYKSLEEGIRCTKTHQLEEVSCTQTQQSSKDKREEGSIICGFVFFIVIGLIVGLLVSCLSSPRTEFNIVEASIMQFNIGVTITAKNFEDNIKSYNKITAIASYKGNQLASVKMTPFKLSGKNIVRLEPIVFEGNNVMIFEPQQLAMYNKETQLEIYSLDLDLDFNSYVTHICCPNLRAPLISNGKVAPTFKVTTCSYKDQ
ncbi:hypothetical protein P8452_68534 [Trifolium repens]|nr:hypothetical protein P8452_68534 [Trifolium repens]